MKHLSKRCLPRWLGKRGLLGMTITEVLLSLFIGSVMLGYAVPNFQSLIINNRTISATNLVVSAINTARSEAIKRGMPVTACASIDYTNCTTAGWHDGWMVFTDEPIAGVMDGPDEVLRIQQEVEVDITLVAGPTFIRFASNGALADADLEQNEFEGIAFGPYEPLPFTTLVANLLPIGSAYAGSSSDDDSDAGGGQQGGSGGGTSSSGGSGGSGGGGVTSGGGSVVFALDVCPRVSGYKGRSVQVVATGQTRTVEIPCSN
ncbi:MAG: GspH/FimT family pseudopilin [Arenicellales bacterium]|nr:GspH/FimT family pseudopilin [Arenicellales bacterium]